MMPALLIRTFNLGCREISSAETRRMLAGSAISNSIESMPGFASIVSARLALRRPEIMTLFPRWCSASASALPMPEPPPVMKIVFPVSFISILLLSRFELTPNPIARCGVLMGKVRAQSFARGLVPLPVRNVRQRGNGNQLMLVETGERCVHHVLSGHYNLARQHFNRPAGFFPERRRSGA